ncbi:MAG: hypothetical protein H8D56_01815 [Planctomycetes bacterium]|nr:hypothetical protein [Planctomycetota bacterium]MBL7146234.1 hypothetical protein [Phycisphaerae bacterium]
MSTGKYISITTINYPTEGVKTIAKTKTDWTILAVADRKTPPDWDCQNVRLLSIEEQKAFDSNFAKECPLDHYAGKNIGYLNNARIMELLSDIRLSDDPNQIGSNMRICYERLVEAQIISQEELHLVDLWLKDIEEFNKNVEMVPAGNLI